MAIWNSNIFKAFILKSRYVRYNYVFSTKTPPSRSSFIITRKTLQGNVGKFNLNLRDFRNIKRKIIFKIALFWIIITITKTDFIPTMILKKNANFPLTSLFIKIKYHVYQKITIFTWEKQNGDMKNYLEP